jgi:hypothetical protein
MSRQGFEASSSVARRAASGSALPRRAWPIPVCAQIVVTAGVHRIPGHHVLLEGDGLVQAAQALEKRRGVADDLGVGGG